MYPRSLRSLVFAVIGLSAAASVEAQTCTLTCSGNISANTNDGVCVATVTVTAPALSATCPAGVTVTGTRSDGQALTAPYPKGVTTITWTARLMNAVISTCLQTVTVADVEAPRILNASATPNRLWPPNHKMRDVKVNYATADNCPGPINCALSVKSDEPVDGLGDGDTEWDWEVVNNHLVRLRSERSGLGDGRVYTVTITCVDASGNQAARNVTVTVPHDQGNPANPKNRLTLHVTPNPSNARFAVNIQSTNASERVSYRITNLQGLQVEARQNLAPNQTVSLGSNYRPGVYVMEVKQGSLVERVQLVKQAN